jgi:hypothetical protein
MNAGAAIGGPAREAGNEPSTQTRAPGCDEAAPPLSAVHQAGEVWQLDVQTRVLSTKVKVTLRGSLLVWQAREFLTPQPPPSLGGESVSCKLIMKRVDIQVPPPATVLDDLPSGSYAMRGVLNRETDIVRRRGRCAATRDR